MNISAVLSIAIRSIRMNPSRGVLILLMVALSTAIVVATDTSTSSAIKAYQRLTNTVSDNTDLTIASKSGEGISADVVLELRKLDGIEQALAISRNATVLFANGRRIRVVSLGVQSKDIGQMGLKLTDGESLESPEDLLIEGNLARNLGVSTGDKVKLLSRAGVTEMRIGGIIEPARPTANAISSNILMRLSQAAKLFRRKKPADTIEVRFAKSADRTKVRETVEAWVQTNYSDLEVRDAESNNLMAMDSIRTVAFGLRLSALLAVVVAAFMVLNSFLISVGERRKNFALMRTVGASRGQVLSMVLTEAFVFGVFGSIAGIGMGIGLCRILNQALENALAIEIEQGALGWTHVLLSVIVGMVGTTASAIIPAIKACRVAPVEVLQRSHTNQVVRQYSVWKLCMLFLILTMGGWYVGTVRLLPPVIILGCATFLILQVLLTYGCLHQLTNAISHLVGRRLGVVTELAIKQILHNPLRSMMTIALVLVGTASAVSIGNSISLHLRNVDVWWHRSFVYDYYIRATAPDLSLSTAEVVPPDLGDEISALAGVQELEMVRLLGAEVADQRVILFIRSYASKRAETLDIDLAEGKEQALKGLLDGGVVVGSVFAFRHKLEIGSTIKLETARGPVDLSVVGISSEYIAGGNVVHIDRAQASKLLEFEGADVYAIKSNSIDDKTLKNSLQSIADREGLIFVSMDQLTQEVRSMTSSVKMSMWIVIFILTLVIGLGVATTMTINVIEKSNEYRLLRTVGASRWQLALLIVFESSVMILIGVLPAMVSGVLICYVTNLSSLALTGFRVDFFVDWWAVFGAAAVVASFGLVAVLMPAWRLAKNEMPASAIV